jgi:hypothetical protein
MHSTFGGKNVIKNYVKVGTVKCFVLLLLLLLWAMEFQTGKIP